MRKKYLFFDIDGTLATGLTTVMPEARPLGGNARKRAGLPYGG